VIFHYRITHRAIKDLEKFDDSIKVRLRKALLRFQSAPLKHAEKLTDSQLGSYRFRVGDYRIIFDLVESDIVVLRIGHRRDIYKRRS